MSLTPYRRNGNFSQFSSVVIFTFIPGGDSQLGMVLVEDINHKAWPTSYIIAHTENTVFGKKVMEVTVDLINADANANVDKALIDGAQCLRNAAISLGVQDRSCLIHGCRVPNGSKKNGKRGTKGSLCSYLSGKSISDEKSLSLTDTVKLSFAINCFVNLSPATKTPHILETRLSMMLISQVFSRL